MSRIFEVTDKVRSHDPRADIDLINRAYVFAAHAHANQKRSSGEPYLSHPLAVANILASLRLDDKSIVTGLLHDTVEDTSVTLEDIQSRFGEDVARLVDGVTKIGKIHFPSSEHKQAENFRKMILATAKDIRVLLVKLADRLHNMRTLGFLPERKQEGISQETMQLYAPLANRLGIHWLSQEMEDLAFSYIDPESYKMLSNSLADHLEGLNQTRERLERILQEAVSRQGVSARVQGRMKHLYSLYQKMERKKLDFDEIYDLVAFRVIVEDMPTCYQTLGVIHSLYRPVPGRFKDYIALPKPNGYQSLHTSIIGPDNFRLEVQIRTEDMHRHAEDGVAAHWLYKDGVSGEEAKRNFQWLNQLTELLQDSDQPGEFLETVRLDLIVQEVYVFSRDGDLFALPRGALPLDFAYAVHTDVGNHCIGVRINGQQADFQTRLHNGDQVEVLTNAEQTPSRRWLQYVRTPRARQAIRQWFRREEKEASVRVGRGILNEIFGKRAKLESKILTSLKCGDVEELQARLGRGEIPVDKLLDVAEHNHIKGLSIQGTKHGLIHAAECCRPLPGDLVLGCFQHGQGMVVHHQDCPHAGEGKQETWVDVKWTPDAGKLYPTLLEIKTKNRRGMLSAVSGSIAKSGGEIEDLRIHQLAGAVTTLTILVEVSDRVHLANVMRAIRRVDDVIRVKRSMETGVVRKSRHGIKHTIKAMMRKGIPRSSSS
ncbi:MAG: bifunctional (p)ppGpp synthetase/guanosine-3',5'-bis(diphosphate) 3'-pyrophosphohydrolase [Zetaproteobacteria bacterium]|nr:MAG: bifunctional (p)ppGpp synthetase/guanosine-3',5'-bis(diphosphate) 3'-pyrophosphohydrolase [Zetaproteobacteria bacterium]